MIGKWGIEGRTWGYPTVGIFLGTSWNSEVRAWRVPRSWRGWFFGILVGHVEDLLVDIPRHYQMGHVFSYAMSRHMDWESLQEKALSHRTSGTLWKLLWWIAHRASRCTAWAGSLQPISTQHWGLTSHVIAQRDGAWNLNPNQNSLATYLYYILHCLMNIYSLGRGWQCWPLVHFPTVPELLGTKRFAGPMAPTSKDKQV